MAKSKELKTKAMKHTFTINFYDWDERTGPAQNKLVAELRTRLAKIKVKDLNVEVNSGDEPSHDSSSPFHV